MAGTAPTGFEFTRTLDAGPVHCSVWLWSRPRGRAGWRRHRLRPNRQTLIPLHRVDRDLPPIPYRHERLTLVPGDFAHARVGRHRGLKVRHVVTRHSPFAGFGNGELESTRRFAKSRHGERQRLADELGHATNALGRRVWITSQPSDDQKSNDEDADRENYESALWSPLLHNHCLS